MNVGSMYGCGGGRTDVGDVTGDGDDGGEGEAGGDGTGSGAITTGGVRTRLRAVKRCVGPSGLYLNLFLKGSGSKGSRTRARLHRRSGAGGGES